MTDDTNQWIPAAQALRTVAERFAASVGFDDPDALREAAKAILERAAAGTLRTAAKGTLPNFAGEQAPLRYWFHLREVEPDGRVTDHDPTTERDDACCIPTDFWRVFKHSAAASQADWASGDFYISEFSEPAGAWSGVARDVQFECVGLPGAELTSHGHADQAGSWAERSDLPKNKGGRRPKYDWPRAIAHVAAIAQSPDGLDPLDTGAETNVSYIAELMEHWFASQGQELPSDSRLRDHAAMVVGAIRELRAAKEDKG
jgi:hypothetical protein